MSVNLKKGQKVELRKDDGGRLRRVVVGLGWDEAKPKGGFFASFKKTQSIDCDATAIVCMNGKLIDNDDIIYFGNLKHKSGAVVHMGDNLTGAGDGDDEQITVDLANLPRSCDRVVFVVNIYRAVEKKQQFGMIENAFIRISDADTNNEICRYNLSDNYNGMTTVIFGEMRLSGGKWEFNAIGQGTQDENIASLAAKFR